METAPRPGPGGAPARPQPEIRVLLFEDTPEDACLVAALLERARDPFHLEVAPSLAAALDRLATGGIDVLLLDLNLPDSRGLETFERAQDHSPTVPVLVLTALADEGLADQAIRQGAQDYILKDRLDSSLLIRAIRYGMERKRGENALRTSEQRFELMARATNDAVWDWDLVTDRIWWNVGVHSFLGYPPDHVGTDLQWWHEHMHAEDRPRVVACMRSVIQGGGRFWLDEYRFRCADGSYACVFDRGYVLQDERGRPVRMIGAMMDITDRKRAEESLRETNETFRTLVQASPLGIALFDAEEKLRIWNAAAEGILGWKAHEVLGRTLPARVPEGLGGLAGRALRGEALTASTFSGARRDGTPVDLSVSTAPLRDAQGGISGAMAILADVTQQKQAEEQRAHLQEQLRQSQKMEAVGRLAGGVAHDFNNLMTAISGYADLLQARARPGDDFSRYADEILKAAHRASSLTRQLLAFSRRQVLQPRVLDLNAVIRGVEGLARQLMGEQVELATVLDPVLGSVRADQGQIEQVLMNLAVNARDAMPGGGRLTIETRNVDLGDDYQRTYGRARTGPHLLLTVSDTGCGMTPEVRAHLFEPFFTTKEQGKGTGLGLATVYGIVKQSDGDIWARSEPGKGSTFLIYLPRVLEAATAQPDEASPAALLRGSETILLAEDSGVVRRLLREVLAQNGYTVLEASEGDEALRLSLEHAGPIHLLVTDMVMPRMSGLEVAARLTAQRPDMKVLYMSGYAEEAVSRHGRLDPGSAFLEKPFTPETLARKVREVLDGNGRSTP